MHYDIPHDPSAASKVYKYVEVNGRLTFINDGSDYEFHTYMIFVRKGTMIVGRSDERFKGSMRIVLHGDNDATKSYFHESMFEKGNKVIVNTGNLTMFGQEVTPKWTRLAQTANIGDTSIEVLDEPTQITNP